MKLPLHYETSYVKEVLYNLSLKDLNNEEWKPIEGFENYAISNYGRLKSLERQSSSLFGNEKMLPEMIMKLIFVKNFNQYLQSAKYQVHCTLSSDGKKYRKSVARLVYFHFVKKFDTKDRTLSVTSKDGNNLNVHYSNLKMISVSEKRVMTFKANRARNRHVIYGQPVSQYTTEGILIKHYNNMYEAAECINVTPESVMDVIHKEFLTSGGYRWFLKSNPPGKEDFMVKNNIQTPQDILNITLWEKLGRPDIDIKNPPPVLNFSLGCLPGEDWKPIPHFETRFMISSKGRVKRLSGWTTTGRKIFLQEKILSQLLSTEGDHHSLFTILNHEGRQKYISTVKLMYYCFVEKFDLYGKTQIVVNRSNPFWNIDLQQLSLHSIHSVLKRKVSQ